MGLVFPIVALVAVAIAHINHTTLPAENSDSLEYLVGAALLTPFARRRLWFGVVLLGDRFLLATILVAATHRPLQQVFMVSGCRFFIIARQPCGRVVLCYPPTRTSRYWVFKNNHHGT